MVRKRHKHHLFHERCFSRHERDETQKYSDLAPELNVMEELVQCRVF